MQGSFTGFETGFNWDVAQSALTLGLNYVGLLDDLTVFNRALTADEVKTVYKLQNGATDLLQKKKECVFRCLVAKLRSSDQCGCCGGGRSKP